MVETNQLLNELNEFCISDCKVCLPEECLDILTKPNIHLKILQQNIRSINKNFNVFCTLLRRLNFACDIIVLSECWLSYVGSLPSLEGYDSYSTTNNFNQNDGVVVFINKQLTFRIEEPMLQECNCLLVKLDGGTVIVAVYRPCEFKDLHLFLTSLGELLRSLKSYTNIILVGDININLIDSQQRQFEYLDMLAFHGLIPAHTLPTRKGSCLDHVVIKSRCTSYTLILETTVTDHESILFCLKTKSNIYNKKKVIRKVNMEGILSDCKQENFSFVFENNINDINDITNLFVKTMSRIIQQNTIIRHIPCRKTALKPWMTSGMLRCLRNRDLMYKKLKQNQYNETLKITYKRYRNFCNNLIKKVKRQYDTQLLKSAGKNSKQLWKSVNAITNRKKCHTTPHELLNKYDNKSEALKTINQFFAKVGKKLAEKTIILAPISQMVSRSPRNSLAISPTDCHEVSSLINNLKNESSAGYDGVSSEILKIIKDVIVPYLTYIFNTCMENGIFPDAFKKSVLIPIHKSGNKNCLDNYRPISILTVFSKLFEKIINSRIYSFLETHNILADSQYGFRRGRSTSDAVHDLTDFVVHKLDERKRCLTIFLDLKKAFDTVSIPILIRKLDGLGMRGLPQLLLSDYLNNRTQKVKIGDEMSEETTVTFGVPQGSVLGPTLFLCYINEMCELKLENCKIIAYADDTTLTFYGDSWEEVFSKAQKGFNTICQWLAANSLTLNTSKTKYMLFTIRRNTKPSTKFQITAHTCPYPYLIDCSCTVLEQVQNITYLGIILDGTLTFQEHITGLTQKVRKLMYIFKQLRLITNDKTLKNVYISLCQSLISYCVTIWGGAVKNTLIKLERAQRLILKICFLKPMLYPTLKLYSDCEVLTVRQIFVLNTILKQHKRTEYKKDQIVTRKRRQINACHVEYFQTSFADRFFIAQGPKLYNKCNVVLDLISKNIHECKKDVSKWLMTLSYQDTEALVNKFLYDI
jgi:hypothetical protein